MQYITKAILNFVIINYQIMKIIKHSHLNYLLSKDNGLRLPIHALVIQRVVILITCKHLMGTTNLQNLWINGFHFKVSNLSYFFSAHLVFLCVYVNVLIMTHFYF